MPIVAPEKPANVRRKIVPMAEGTPRFMAGRCECGAFALKREGKFLRCRCGSILRNTATVYADDEKAAALRFVELEKGGKLSWCEGSS